MIAPYNWDEDRYYGWTGSGTIVSSFGHVLTNAHVIEDEVGNALKLVPIWTTDSAHPAEAAQFSYLASVVEVNEELDLALLLIVADAQFEYLPDDHRFPYAPIGTIEGLQLGDPIYVIGFPGISGNTITFTGGVVSGFLGADLRGSGDAWVKTDARIAKGNSGGGAFDTHGTLVGVPTLILQGDAGAIQELFRPINFAFDMIARNVPLEYVQIGPRDYTTGTTPIAPPSSRRANQSGARIKTGIVVDGSLDFTDAQYFPNRFANAFTVLVPQAGSIELSAESNEFDPYLVLLSPGGQVRFEIDDSKGAGTNIEENLGVAEPGTYTIVITTAFPGESGAYSLSVATGTAAGDIEVARVAVPLGVGNSTAPTYNGYWSGYLLDSAGGRGAVVANLVQTGNAIVEGTWQATFQWGTTSGTLVGVIQSEGLFLELYPDDETACPFSGLAELSGFTIAGAYTAFNCAVPIAGSVSLTKRSQARP